MTRQLCRLLCIGTVALMIVGTVGMAQPLFTASAALQSDDDSPDPPEIDDDPTAEPTEEVDPPTPPDDGGGDDPSGNTGNASDGNSYTDDANGWSITWDESWNLTSDPAEDGFLSLDNGTSTVFASVLAETNNALDCVGDQVVLLVDGEATSSVSRLLQSGEVIHGGDENAAFGAYRYNFKTENASIKMTSHYDCRILPSGEDALLISLLVVQGSYASEVEGFQALLDAVTIDG